MRGRGEGVELCRHVWWGGVGEGGCMFGEEEKGGGGEGEVRHVYYSLLLVFLVLGFPNSCSKLGLKKTFPQTFL